MDRLWLDAPLPALYVAAEGGGHVVRPNAAALEWARRHGVDLDRLRGWAADSPPVHGSVEVEQRLGGQRVRCVPVPLSDRPGHGVWWLQPQPDETVAEASAARARREAEFLDRALVMAGVSAWRIDPVAQRIHFNAVGFRASGMTEDPAGIALDQLRATIHPDDRAGVFEAAARALASDGVVDAVARYRNVDGSWRTLLTRRIADRDAEGSPVGLAGVSIDLTALLHERERSQALADRTRLVADALGAGFWTRDIESGEESWDDALFRIHGLPPELGPPAPGRWVVACVHPDDQTRMAEIARQEDERFEAASQTVFRIHDRDGQPRWVHSWASRVVRNGRRIVCGMTMDVTERRAADAAQAEKKRLEQASREKSAFMARMSHELRTPMNAVLGFTRLIETDAEQPPSERQRERLAHIAGAGQQLMRLIDDLLETAHREPAAPPVEAASRLHVLCVEDNPVNLQLVRELIALRPRVRLRTAVDGLSGVEAARAEPPDLVLLDLQLPDIDGLEVLRRLRADATTAGCRIVALSADAMADHIRGALAAGFDDYWTKPIQFDHFLSEIDRLCVPADAAAARDG